MKWLVPIVAIIVAMWLASSLLGMPIFALNTILIVAFAYLLLQKFNVLPAMLALPIKGKMLTPLLVVVFLAAFFLGAFAVISPILTMEGISGTLSGQVIPGVTTVITPVSPAAMAECPVTDELRGKSATLTVNAYDMAANSPYSAAVDTAGFMEKNGEIVAFTDTTAGSVTSYSVGDSVAFRGGNGSYYLADKAVCVDKQQMPVELDAYAVAANTETEISCYDDTGSASCTSATNNTQEDNVIALGASGEKSYYLKLEEATANKAYNLYGIGLAAFNDINEVDLVGPDSGDGSSWSKAVVPDFMSTTTFAEDDAAPGTNMTGGFDTLYTRDQGPMLLLEWDSAKYKFNIKAGSTDPTASTTFTSKDIAIVCFFDAVVSRGRDGELYLDLHDHGDSEANVGMDEDVDTPVTSGTAADICHVMAGS